MTGPPTLRQAAQGRGEPSRTTIKTFGGDGLGINSHQCFWIPRQLAAGRFIVGWALLLS